MMSDDEVDAVVVDNGSWMIKAGYAGTKTACVYERTVIGRRTDESTQQIGSYIGDKACFPPGCSLSWPMDRGSVVDWEQMELIWDFVFTHELKDDVRDRPMLITEIPGNPHSNRDKIVEILMEKYEVSSLYMIDPGSLAMVASGRTSGIVLDVGGSTTHVTALYEGKNLKLSKNDDGKDELSKLPWRSDIGGNDVTKYLQQIVCKKLKVDSGAWNLDKSFQDVEKLKHSLVSWQYTGDSNFSFSDGTKLTMDEDLLKCSEVLFHPELAGLNVPGIDSLLNEALSSCEDGVKEELYSNVILSGGTSLSHGIYDRIISSLKDGIDGDKYNIKVIAPPERRKSTWLGGSIIASLDAFTSMCKSRETYNEKGVADFLRFSGLEFLMKLS